MTIKEISKKRMLMSTRLLKNIKYKGQLFKNDIPCFVTERVQKNDVLRWCIYEKVNDYIKPVCLPFSMVYDTEDFCVVNKPKYMPTHPSPGHETDTLLNALAYEWGKKGPVPVIRPINRLDCNTTGLMLIAKTQYAAKLLTDQLHNQKIQKEYAAIVIGQFSKERGAIKEPIARKEGSIIERCVDPNGKSSHTYYEVRCQKDKGALVHLVPFTGRTHQLRVHMAYLEHPLLGDTLYGDETPSLLIDRYALHCEKLTFLHPFSGEQLSFQIDLPTDMKIAWKNM